MQADAGCMGAVDSRSEWVEARMASLKLQHGRAGRGLKFPGSIAPRLQLVGEHDAGSQQALPDGTPATPHGARSLVR